VAGGGAHQAAVPVVPETLGRPMVIARVSRGVAVHPNGGRRWLCTATRSQGLLDLFKPPSKFRCLEDLPRHPQALAGKRIAIIGDVLHSRVGAQQSLGSERPLRVPIVVFVWPAHPPA